MVEAGSVLGNYKVVEEIGKGGIATVYKAIQQTLDRTVALKVLRDTCSKGIVKRFLQGTKAAVQLSHPNIIRIYGLGMHEGRHFMSMEYIEGKILEKVMQGQSESTCMEILPILLPVLDAVGYFHKQRVVHCDLKSKNILVDKNNKPYVFDFDLGGTLDDELDEKEKRKVYGTHNYVAPERFVKELRTDTRADIFSIGVILYEILTGHVPYEDDSRLLTAPSFESLIRPSRFNPEIPKGLEEVCIAALKRDREKRIQTAEEFSKALKEFC